MTLLCSKFLRGLVPNMYHPSDHACVLPRSVLTGMRQSHAKGTQIVKQNRCMGWETTFIPTAFLYIQIQENVSHQDDVSDSMTSLLKGEAAFIVTNENLILNNF